MTSVYPGDIDSFPTVTGSQSKVGHADLHNDLAAAIVAIETSHSHQEQIDAASSGDTVVLQPGITRAVLNVNKPLQIIHLPGAEVRGSDDWSDDTWTSIAQGWRSTLAATNFGYSYDAVRHTNSTLSPEAAFVFVDEVPQQLMEVGATTITLAPGQYSIDASRRVVLGTNPAGHLVEVTARTQWYNTTSDDITLVNVQARHCGNNVRDEAALGNFPAATSYNNLSIINPQLYDTYGPAIYFTGGTGNAVRGGALERCGNVGIAFGDQDDFVLDNVEVCYSNYWGLFQTSWESGGIKGGMNTLAHTPVTIDITRMDCHDNNGIGIWLDVFFDGGVSKTIAVNNNRAWRNSYAGIQFEISRNITCEDNVTYLNGYSGGSETPVNGGIVVYNCDNIIPTRCVSAWNADGIIFFVDDRTEHTELAAEGYTYADTHAEDCYVIMGRPRAVEVSNLGIHHVSLITGFDITAPAGASYHGQDTGNLLWWPWPEGATFSGDEPDANRFGWASLDNTAYTSITTLKEMQTAGGFDTTNRYMTDLEMLQVLSYFEIPQWLDPDFGSALPTVIMPGVVLDSSTPATVTATSATTLGASLSLAARALSRGTHIRLEAWGVYTTTGAATLTLRLMNSATALATTGAVANVAVTNRGWHLTADIRVNDSYDFGAGTWEIQGMLQLAGQTTNFLVDLENTSAPALNATAASDIHLDVAWSAASQSISIRQLTMEVLPYVPSAV